MNHPSREPGARRGWRRLYVVVAAVVIMAAVGAWAFRDSPALPTTLPGDLRLEETLQGREAQGFLEHLVPGVDRVLGKEVEGAQLGVYEKGVWLGVFPVGGCEAVRQVAGMLGGEGPLTEALERRTELGGVYYIAIGKLDSSVHVFWCHEGRLVWLRVPAVAPSQVVEGTLEALPPSP